MQCGDSFKLLYDLWNLKNKTKLQPEKDLAGCCWCCINTELYMWKWREGKRKVAQPEMPLTCDLIALNNILPGPHIQESRSSAVAIQNVVISWKKSFKKMFVPLSVAKERPTKTRCTNVLKMRARVCCMNEALSSWSCCLLSVNVHSEIWKSDFTTKNSSLHNFSKTKTNY